MFLQDGYLSSFIHPMQICNIVFFIIFLFQYKLHILGCEEINSLNIAGSTTAHDKEKQLDSVKGR